jgi:hypothetical protein
MPVLSKRIGRDRGGVTGAPGLDVIRTGGPEVPWFKVDDKLHDQRKVRKLGRDNLPGFGSVDRMWILVGRQCYRRVRSPGRGPKVQRYDPKGRYARGLVAVGLWVEEIVDGEDGYRFHDWDEYQPSSAEVEERRKRRVEAGRFGGLRSAEARRAHQINGAANAQTKLQQTPKQDPLDL